MTTQPCGGYAMYGPGNFLGIVPAKGKTLWRASDVAWMPSIIYFGSHSSSWNSSVAFLKPDQGTTPLQGLPDYLGG